MMQKDPEKDSASSFSVLPSSLVSHDSCRPLTPELAVMCQAGTYTTMHMSLAVPSPEARPLLVFLGDEECEMRCFLGSLQFRYIVT